MLTALFRSLVGSSLTPTVGNALKGAWDKLQASQAAERDALRSLLLEVDHNLVLLSKYRLDDTESEGVSTTDPQFTELGAALRIEAHREVLFALPDHEASAQGAAKRRKELEDALCIPVTIVLPNGHERVEIDEGALDAALRERRYVGVLPAASFVVSRVEALRTFREISASTAAIAKNVRVGVRLRTIQAYEVALRLALREACGDLHPPKRDT